MTMKSVDNSAEQTATACPTAAPIGLGFLPKPEQEPEVTWAQVMEQHTDLIDRTVKHYSCLPLISEEELHLLVTETIWIANQSHQKATLSNSVNFSAYVEDLVYQEIASGLGLLVSDFPRAHFEILKQVHEDGFTFHEGWRQYDEYRNLDNDTVILLCILDYNMFDSDPCQILREFTTLESSSRDIPSLADIRIAAMKELCACQCNN